DVVIGEVHTSEVDHQQRLKPPADGYSRPRLPPSVESICRGSLMHQLAWVRLMVARHPAIYWLTVSVVAAAVALGAARAVDGVDAARRSWGRQQTVWVASAPSEPGQPIRSAPRHMPSAVVPADAVGTEPAGALARQHVGAGEIITGADINPRGTAGLVPNGWVAFALPPAVGQFGVGDHLSVYAAGQLASAGLVVGDTDAALMVAVPADAAATIATALLTDAVTLALTPDP
ncbi:MAG: hypothetical protein ABI706_19940, partial [Ilumatobacteraceae bacterium]